MKIGFALPIGNSPEGDNETIGVSAILAVTPGEMALIRLALKSCAECPQEGAEDHPVVIKMMDMAEAIQTFMDDNPPVPKSSTSGASCPAHQLNQKAH